MLPVEVRISVADRLSSVITDPYHRVRNFGDDVFRVRRQNADLQSRVTSLELQMAQRERTVRDQAREIVNDLEFPAAGTLWPCEVVARKRGRYAQMIKIRSDIPLAWQLYQPVITPRGLLGRIRLITSPQTAWVELLAAPEVAIGCELVRNGLLGILRSRGGKYILDMVGRDEDVQVGDRVVTSGLAEVVDIGEETEGLAAMPRGLPVGRVVAVSSPLEELFKKVTVEPFADFDVNERVLVVAAGPAQGSGSRP
jgi:rod shape-determining protein MreC